ncbi:MAG: hypothetical protein KatS3mg076_0278 [Candidatus Binatia bacterium]|nr:MAG: hypothetical protein KatS3mg076_0278 [Candidatus Binatia bacterium]
MARVLLLLRSDNLRLPLSRILRRAGHEVASARTAEEAQRTLATAHFDAVLSEVDPPGELTGAELCERARHSGCRTRFFLVVEGPHPRLLPRRENTGLVLVPFPPDAAELLRLLAERNPEAG